MKPCRASTSKLDVGLARAFRKTCAIRFSKNGVRLASSTRKKRTGNLASCLDRSQPISWRGLFSLQRAQYRRAAESCQPDQPCRPNALQCNRFQTTHLPRATALPGGRAPTRRVEPSRSRALKRRIAVNFRHSSTLRDFRAPPRDGTGPGRLKGIPLPRAPSAHNARPAHDRARRWLSGPGAAVE